MDDTIGVLHTRVEVTMVRRSGSSISVSFWSHLRNTDLDMENPVVLHR